MANQRHRRPPQTIYTRRLRTPHEILPRRPHHKQNRPSRRPLTRHRKIPIPATHPLQRLPRKDVQRGPRPDRQRLRGPPEE